MDRAIRMTVKDIKDKLAGYDDDQKVCFTIGEDDLKKLADDYRYEPTISSVYLGVFDDLVITISSVYAR